MREARGERPHFEVQLYTLLESSFDMDPYARLDASLQGCVYDQIEYDFTLSAGAVGYADMQADVLDLFVLESPPLTVFDISDLLEQWYSAPPAPPADPNINVMDISASPTQPEPGDDLTITVYTRNDGQAGGS